MEEEVTVVRPTVFGRDTEGMPVEYFQDYI